MSPLEEAIARAVRETQDARDGTPAAHARIAAVVDPGSFFELAALARSHRDEEAATPADGLVGGFAEVAGRRISILADEAAVAERSSGEVARLKRDRLMKLAAEAALPLVYLADPGTPRAPTAPGEPIMKGAALFGGNPLLEPRPLMICTVLGLVSGDSARLAATADLTLASPAANGSAALADHVAGSEAAALADTRRALELLLASHTGAPDAGGGIYEDVDIERAGGIDLQALAGALCDTDSTVFLDAPGSAALVTGFARLGGRSIAVAFTRRDGGACRLGVAEVRQVARLAQLCGRAGLPLLTIQDVDGYAEAPGEQQDLVRQTAQAGAELRNGGFLKASLIAGAGFSLGEFVLGGRDLGFDYIAAWPTARVPLHRDGTIPEEGGPWLAAGLHFVDDIVAPQETRTRLRSMFAFLDPDSAKAGC